MTLQGVIAAVNALPWVNNDRRLTGASIQSLLLQILAYIGGLSAVSSVLFGRTTVADLNGYEMQPTDYTAAFTGLTASRTIYLPSCSLVSAEQPYAVVDESGFCSPTLTITVSASAEDSIAGQATVTLAAPFQRITFKPNGVDLWTF